MDCQTFKNQCLDYLYDEMEDPADRVAMEQHLESCPACRLATGEIHITRRFLSAWPEEELPSPPVIRPAGTKRQAAVRPWRKGPGRPVWLAAAVALFFFSATLVLVGSQARFRVGRNSVELSFGGSAAPALPATEEKLLAEVGRLIMESEQRQTMLAAHQKEYYEGMLLQFKAQTDLQREQDRRDIQDSFQWVGERYMEQIEKNNQLLDWNLNQPLRPANFKN